jgi:hypothetical protein
MKVKYIYVQLIYLYFINEIKKNGKKLRVFKKERFCDILVILAGCGGLVEKLGRDCGEVGGHLGTLEAVEVCFLVGRELGKSVGKFESSSIKSFLEFLQF